MIESATVNHAASAGSGLVDREALTFFQTYRRLPIGIVRGEGMYMYDTEGKRYLDFLSGIAVNALGHGHPKVKEALFRQAEKYLHVSNYFYQEPQIELAEILTRRSGLGRVFFSNSGTESIEAAVKLTRKWGVSRGKGEMLAFSGGFHGRTYASLSLMDKPLYKDGMGPFLEGMHVLPFNDPGALREAVNERTAAVVLEFLQGEGGITFASPEFVCEIENLREQFGFLLIADEVQAGVGRTGTFFSYDRYMVRPDIVVLAKAIGGGLPLGAILASDSVAAAFSKGHHGTTFGGNPLACAVGSVVCREVEQSLMKNAHDVGCYLQQRLTDISSDFPDLIADQRGCGMMQGLGLRQDAQPLVLALIDRGVVTNATAGNVLRLLPPLICAEEHVDQFISALVDALSSLRQTQ